MPWRNTKRYLIIKSIMLQQRGQMSVTMVVFSELLYQLIVKYFWPTAPGLLHEKFLLSVIMCAMQKNMNELMKNSIERKYGSNGSYTAVIATDASNGNNTVDKATAEKASEKLLVYSSICFGGCKQTHCSSIRNHSKWIDKQKMAILPICWPVCENKVTILTTNSKKHFLAIMLFICLMTKVTA